MAYIRKTSDIFISQKLKDLLVSISNESKIAKKLLKGRHLISELVDNPINYICISNSDNTKISYLTKDKIQNIEPSEYWKSSRRYQARPGASMTKIFKDLDPREVEIFSSLFISYIEKVNMSFSVVSGKDIKKWYRHENYSKQSSSLGMSCMKHDNCQEYLDFYSANPQVKMVILLNGLGKMIGRALIWETDEFKIMDRIYTIDDNKYTYLFQSWAEENGYWSKRIQNYNSPLHFKAKSGEIKQKISIKLNKITDLFPYLDTFKFLDTRNKTIHNFIPDNKENLITLISCEGGYLGSEALKFDDIDNYVYWAEHIRYLDYCNLNVNNDRVVYSGVNCRYQLSDHSVYNNEIDDYIFNDEYGHLNADYKLCPKKKLVFTPIPYPFRSIVDEQPMIMGVTID